MTRLGRLRGAADATPAAGLGRARGAAAVLAALAGLALLGGCAADGPRGSASPAGPIRLAATASPASPASPASADSTSSAAACNPYASLAPEAGGPSVTAGSWAATIRAHGFLVAGVDQTTYHFGYLNPLDGQVEGFDTDMVKEVAAAIFGLRPDSPALAAHIHLKAITNAERITDVENGTVDIVADTMTVNCARMQEVDFSSIYYDAKQRVLVDAPAAGQTAPDLTQLGAAHQKVCAATGSDSVAHIQAAGATAVQATYWSDCLVLLEEGQVAGVSTDDSILYGMQAQDPGTVVTGPALEDEPYGLAISKAHPDFVSFVNAVLAADRANGDWAKSYRTWVSATAPLPTWPIDYSG